MAGKIYIPKRYILTFLAHLGFIVLYAIRVDLSIAMVSMVNTTYTIVKPSMEAECRNGNNYTADMKVSLVKRFIIIPMYIIYYINYPYKNTL